LFCFVLFVLFCFVLFVLFVICCLLFVCCLFVCFVLLCCCLLCCLLWSSCIEDFVFYTISLLISFSLFKKTKQSWCLSWSVLWPILEVHSTCWRECCYCVVVVIVVWLLLLLLCGKCDCWFYLLFIFWS
jgi:hypothetical protein